MLEETWYNDRQAVDAGLADEVDGDATAENSFDLSIFRHPPEDLLIPAPADDAGGGPTKRDIERALRDAGLTRAQAKAFVAKAYDGSKATDEAWMCPTCLRCETCSNL